MTLQSTLRRVLLCASLGLSANAMAVMMSVDLDPSTPGVQGSASASVGSQALVDIVLDSGATSVTGGQFILSWDPAVVDLVGTSTGAGLPAAYMLLPMPLPGSLYGLLVSMPMTATSGANVWASLVFEVIGAGSNPFSLSSTIVMDATVQQDELPHTTQGATLRAVPEPGIAMLLLTGLLGAVPFSRPSRATART